MGIFNKAICNFLDVPIKQKRIAVKHENFNENKKQSVASKVVSSMYYNAIDWTNSFYNTEIYNMCANAIIDQIYDLIDDIQLCEVPMNVELDFAEDYWYRDIQDKYSKQQLHRVEREFNKGKDSVQLCYEMLYFTWSKIIPSRCKSNDVLQDSDLFKIRNKFKKSKPTKQIQHNESNGNKRR